MVSLMVMEHESSPGLRLAPESIPGTQLLTASDLQCRFEAADDR